MRIREPILANLMIEVYWNSNLWYSSIQCTIISRSMDHIRISKLWTKYRYVCCFSILFVYWFSRIAIVWICRDIQFPWLCCEYEQNILHTGWVVRAIHLAWLNRHKLWCRKSLVSSYVCARPAKFIAVAFFPHFFSLFSVSLFSFAPKHIQRTNSRAKCLLVCFFQCYISHLKRSYDHWSNNKE